MIVSALRREGAVSRHPRELGEPMDAGLSVRCACPPRPLNIGWALITRGLAIVQMNRLE
jgi:hypothetical protein